MTPLLELNDVSARYGQIVALHGVSLTVGEGEVVALLGANGAGKTTTLRAISGTVKTSGDIVFEGRRLRGGPEAAARRGIAHVPEGRGTFVELTVRENLRLGAYTARGRKAADATLEYVYRLFPRLQERAGVKAGRLSGGEQQMVGIGRALMAKPSILILDEPSLGLAPKLVSEIFEKIHELRKGGLTVLMVEQNAYAALRIADFGYVMQNGQVVRSGPTKDLLDLEALRRDYFAIN